MDTQQTARDFLVAHNKLSEIATDLAPYEARYLSLDGLGSAGMQIDGVFDYYTQRSSERAELVKEMKRLRTEVGDKAILAELANVQGSEHAVEYIRKVPLREDREKDATRVEVKKGFFGRFR